MATNSKIELPQADAQWWTPAHGELKPVDIGCRRCWLWEGSRTKLHKTGIEWADYTINPFLARHTETGKLGWACQKASEGCANCYAESWNGRNLPARGTGLSYSASDNKLIEPVLDLDALKAIIRAKPRGPFKNGRDRPALFPCDMTDWMWEFWPDGWVDRLLAVFALQPAMDFLLLTKRPELMAQYFELPVRVGRIGCTTQRMQGKPGLPGDRESAMEVAQVLTRWPLPNVWLGTSVENQPQADKRIPELLKCPAAVRFLSIEPLLGPVEVPHFMHAGNMAADWLILGGESGRNARPCDLANIRSLLEQGKAAEVPCFVKQLGACIGVPNDQLDQFPREGDVLACLESDDIQPMQGETWRYRLSDPKGGEPSQWPEDLRVRQMPHQSDPREGGHEGSVNQ